MATEDPTTLDLNAPEVAPAKKKKKTNKEQYAAQRAKERELGIIEQARFKRINTALGRKTTPGEAQNFVVEKPLEPNALDEYQAKKIQQRDTIRNQKAFVPVQKL